LDITTLEAYTLRAWPTLETEDYDGWTLRFANGYTGRANSVYPLYASTVDLDTKLDYCEAFYRARGLNASFKLTAASCPPELDAELAQRGYARQSDTGVMALDLSTASLPEPTVPVQLDDHAEDAWIDAYCAFNPAQVKHRATIGKLLAKIEPRRHFASVRLNGETAAIGLAVHDGEYVGLFDIAVRAEARRQGIGRALVSALLRQAQADGAAIGYLQVVAGNTPAISLYQQLGFQSLYPYWYRIKQLKGES
jgi:ribosomal protein S18 acetylase RimI-like enzyme